MTTMFLRSTVVKKGGKSYRYCKMVKTGRTATGSRQRVVAHLGDLAHFTGADWEALAVGWANPPWSRPWSAGSGRGAGRAGRPSGRSRIGSGRRPTLSRSSWPR
jgi:hypothetical protein